MTKVNKTPNPVDFEKGEVNEIDRALEKLKECAKPINYMSWRTSIDYEELREAAQNLVEALEAKKKVTQEHYDLEAVTRLEIIDSNGRSYVNLHANPMKFSYQDDGKTLKIFCNNDMSKPEPKIDIKEERVEPISIWKDVGNLPKVPTDCLIKTKPDTNLGVCFGVFQNTNTENTMFSTKEGRSISKKQTEKYCTLTDFINSFEQMQKDIQKLMEANNVK